MFLGVALLITVAVGGAPANEICKRLAREFDANEYAMAITHDLNAKLHAANQIYADSVGTDRARAGVETLAARLESDDGRHMAMGDRITALLIANRCTAPSHVTSWYTFDDSNPNRKVYERPATGR